MKLDDFYFYSYLASQITSTYSFFAASITMNIPKSNILVCFSPPPLIFLLLAFKSETKTFLNCLPAKIKGLRQLLNPYEMSVCIC